MSEYQEFTGKSVEEAIKAACDAFGVGLGDLDFEILTPGSRGVLGMGAEPARIVAASRSALGGAAPKREAAESRPLPTPPAREDRGPRRDFGDRDRDRGPRRDFGDRGGPGDRGRGERGGFGDRDRGGDRGRGTSGDRPAEGDRGPRRDAADRPPAARIAGRARPSRTAARAATSDPPGVARSCPPPRSTR